MTKTYNKHEHAFVMLEHPTAKRGEGWDQPFEIVLYSAGRVWVPGSYAHERHHDMIQVGDGLSNGFDADGNCIYSVPVSWVTDWYTPAEAEAICMCMDEDEKLLSYAR